MVQKKKAPEAKAVVKKEPRPTKKPFQPAVPTYENKNILVRIGGYFTGSWSELKEVQWPTRKATWGLTIAVLLYSAFFVALIILLDIVFKFLFEQILK